MRGGGFWVVDERNVGSHKGIPTQTLLLVTLVTFGYSSAQECSVFGDPVILVINDELTGGQVPE